MIGVEEAISLISSILDPEEDNLPVDEDNFESHLSTDKANYHFSFEHEMSEPVIDNQIMEGSDALVLEEGATRYEHLELEDLEDTPHHGDIIDDNLRGHNNPIYLVDMPEKNIFDYEENMNRNLAKGFGLPIAAGIAGAAAGIPEASLLSVPAAADWIKEKPFFRDLDNKATREVFGGMQLTRFYTVFSMRSAIVADKMERGVSSHVKDEYPNISLNYGQGHQDIVNYLRFPILREKVIRYNSRNNYEGKDEEYLDKICVFEPESEEDEVLSASDYTKEVVTI